MNGGIENQRRQEGYQEETLLHHCQNWSKFDLYSFRKMKRKGGNIWTK